MHLVYRHVRSLQKKLLLAQEEIQGFKQIKHGHKDRNSIDDSSGFYERSFTLIQALDLIFPGPFPAHMYNLDARRSAISGSSRNLIPVGICNSVSSDELSTNCHVFLIIEMTSFIVL